MLKEGKRNFVARNRYVESNLERRKKATRQAADVPDRYSTYVPPKKGNRASVPARAGKTGDPITASGDWPTSKALSVPDLARKRLRRKYGG